MNNTLPGTRIEVAPSDFGSMKELFNNLFMCGGLVLSQVCGLTGLEPYMVQNWVKRKFVSPPKKKQYTQRQFCRIALINMLRESMQIDKIAMLFSYINGKLDDESDDMIDDSELYFYYLDCISRIDYPKDEKYVEEKINDVVKDFNSSYPYAKERLVKVLSVIVHAHFSSVLARKTNEIINTFDEY